MCNFDILLFLLLLYLLLIISQYTFADLQTVIIIKNFIMYLFQILGISK